MIFNNFEHFYNFKNYNLDRKKYNKICFFSVLCSIASILFIKVHWSSVYFLPTLGLNLVSNIEKTKFNLLVKLLKIWWEIKEKRSFGQDKLKIMN